jgi:hypothetical protein
MIHGTLPVYDDMCEEIVLLLVLLSLTFRIIIVLRILFDVACFDKLRNIKRAIFDNLHCTI